MQPQKRQKVRIVSADHHIWDITVARYTCGFFCAVKGVGSTTVLDESTNEIVEIPNEKPEPTTAGDIVPVAAPILLFCNIPTAVFMLEYALFTTKKREDQEKELDKSQIVDL